MDGGFGDHAVAGLGLVSLLKTGSRIYQSVVPIMGIGVDGGIWSLGKVIKIFQLAD
jgi:hypothetical protein